MMNSKTQVLKSTLVWRGTAKSNGLSICFSSPIGSRWSGRGAGCNTHHEHNGLVARSVVGSHWGPWTSTVREAKGFDCGAMTLMDLMDSHGITLSISNPSQLAPTTRIASSWGCSWVTGLEMPKTGPGSSVPSFFKASKDFSSGSMRIPSKSWDGEVHKTGRTAHAFNWPGSEVMAPGVWRLETCLVWRSRDHPTIDTTAVRRPSKSHEAPYEAHWHLLVLNPNSFCLKWGPGSFAWPSMLDHFTLAAAFWNSSCKKERTQTWVTWGDHFWLFLIIFWLNLGQFEIITCIMHLNV